MREEGKVGSRWMSCAMNGFFVHPLFTEAPSARLLSSGGETTAYTSPALAISRGAKPLVSVRASGSASGQSIVERMKVLLQQSSIPTVGSATCPRRIKMKTGEVGGVEGGEGEGEGGSLVG